MEPTINFNLEDYEELGNIKDLIERASDPLKLELIDLETTNNEIGLNLDIANATQLAANLITPLNDRLEFLNNTVQTGLTLTKAIAATQEVSSGRFNELANSLASPILNFDSISTELDSISNIIQSSNSLINSPINVQASDEDDIAVVFNEEIRGDVVDTVTDINSSLNIFSGNQNSVGNLTGKIESYQNNFNLAYTGVRELKRQLISFPPAFVIPGIQQVYTQILSDLAIAEQNIIDLLGKTSSILNQTLEFQSNLESRAEELEILRDYFDFLLTVELDLEAEWNAGAEFASDPRYEINFRGNEDLPNSIELEGTFPLGELFVKNNISFTDSDTTEPVIDFFLTRVVQDPILGSITTVGNTQIVASYKATPNTENPRESADIIQIPSLGINVNIFEEDTYGPLTVFARYDSPLEIVAIEPAPNAEGGFITPFEGEEPVNTPPIAENDSATTNQLRAVSIDVLANDSDPDTGDTLSVTSVDKTGTQGIVTINPDNTITYDPNGQFEALNDGETATDAFTYTIDDGNGGTDTATVVVTINGVDGVSGSEILGTPGRDNLTGTDGDDVITGFEGRDSITTGGGQDRIVYTGLVDAGDIITDFEVGSDIIDLVGVLDSAGYSGSDPIGDGYIGFSSSSGGTLINIDADGSGGSGSPRAFILVQGVGIDDMNDLSNFVVNDAVA